MRGIWLALGAAWLGGAALADTAFSVTLPDVSGLDRSEARLLIAQLAEVNVITSNCADWTVDDATWALLTGTGDVLAMQLGIDPAAYDDMYFGPAFALLDDPTACDRIGPMARPLIARLQAMGARMVTRSADSGGQTGSESGPASRSGGGGPQVSVSRGPKDGPETGFGNGPGGDGPDGPRGPAEAGD